MLRWPYCGGSPSQSGAWLFIGLAYVIAAASFARVGLVGSGRLYLVFLPALAIVLVGQRAGYLCLGVSLFEFAIFTEMARLGFLSKWLTETANPVDVGTWIESGAALAVILLTLSVLLERFFTRHVFTLEVSHRIRGELEKAYRALSQRVTERTRELALLNSVAAVASGLTDIRRILTVSLEKTLEAFGIEAGGAYGMEEETGTMVMLAHTGLSENFFGRWSGWSLRMPWRAGSSAWRSRSPGAWRRSRTGPCGSSWWMRGCGGSSGSPWWPKGSWSAG